MQKVRVYWNLHKKTWSVQDYKSGLVIDHQPTMVLEQAKFVVRKGGQERVRKEGKKNVHAFAVGLISTDQDMKNTFQTIIGSSIIHILTTILCNKDVVTTNINRQNGITYPKISWELYTWNQQKTITLKFTYRSII